ncbi:uncharacterized protein CANTADRAFT_45119 [Suhomyces tanzawaensis NRRL Y-17324]|uniref:Uncharacterized protein n=1 Tax=Suhomyces tanzawaensis NRRL Y-17324 TaxID=984487 RepID=A0A1E4SSC4_9ASCO|nr:uncharacterized protein CANTADRAFT_45119 [Suhomyces tanzawaensis NRRL Y-17324]ODV82292.1 hypothetical protein CANTADRAFT_45119 [Suhomyces tanzawaensis NRRL Y-17324]
MVSLSDTLVAVLDLILNSIDDLNKVEYNKKGRKYRFVNNTFQRIREEDKHLIICPEDLSLNLALILSYFILYNINGGDILSQYPDFCLAIMGVAQQLEQHQWYEEENSLVIHLKNSKYNPMAVQQMALDYATLHHQIEERHITMGLNLMMCAKLNFLHTDHHIGTKLEGYYMKHFISEYFGADALVAPDVLVALKSFVHWGNIKGILYKLEVPDVQTTAQLRANFAKFPDPMEELKLSVYDRYPSGTSKYSLIRKSIDILGDWKYSKLVPYPSFYDLNWLYELCHNIEKNPIKYHLRSSTKSLCEDPVNLTELSNKHSTNIKSLLTLISLIINVFHETGGEFLLQNSKIPKLTDELIAKNRNYYTKLVKIQAAIESYEEKGWDSDDIVLRLNNGDTANNQSFFDTVMAMREKYIDDYE